MLSDLQDKTLTEVDDSRHAESIAAHNFALLEQSSLFRTSGHRAPRPLRKRKWEKNEISTAFEAENADFQITTDLEGFEVVTVVWRFAKKERSLGNKAVSKAKTENSEFASSLEAERADLAEAEKSLAAVLASVAASKNSCAQVASRIRSSR